MNHLSLGVVEKIKEVFLSGVSINKTAVTCQVSRNSVRTVLRREGLCYPAPTQQTSKIVPDVQKLDLDILERLFDLGKEQGENLKFKENILGLAKSFAEELGVTGSIDAVRLQDALFQYIVYRRFYFKSLDASDKKYDGPFSRSHEKSARAVLDWVKASQEALKEFHRIIRELEVKYGKRLPHFGGRGVFIQNQLNVAQGNPSVG